MEDLAESHENANETSDFVAPTNSNSSEKWQTIRDQVFVEDEEIFINAGEQMTITGCKFHGITTFYVRSGASLQLDNTNFYQDVSIKTDELLQNESIFAYACNFFGRVVCTGIPSVQFDDSTFRHDVSIDASILNSDNGKNRNLILTLAKSKFFGHVEIECDDKTSLQLNHSTFNRDVCIGFKKSSNDDNSNKSETIVVYACEFFESLFYDRAPTNFYCNVYHRNRPIIRRHSLESRTSFHEPFIGIFFQTFETHMHDFVFWLALIVLTIAATVTTMKMRFFFAQALE